MARYFRYQCYWLVYGALTALLSVDLAAQLPPASFHHLKRDERLLSSMFHCLAEDPNGFIWFGSYHGGGLYRYDGYDLRSFVIDPARMHESLPSNRVNSVYAFGDNELYIGTHGGLAVMDITTGEMSCYLDDLAKSPDYIAFYVEPIVHDTRHARDWIGTKYGLFYLDWSKDSIYHVAFPDMDVGMPSFRAIIDMILDNSDENLLWLGTDQGLFSYRIDDALFSYHACEGASFIVMDICQSGSDDLWIAVEAKESGGDRAEVLRYRPASMLWQEYPVFDGHDLHKRENAAYALIPTTDPHKFWIATYTDVGIMDTNSGSFTSWDYQSVNPDGLLPNGFYRALMGDRHGRLWISSWQGVHYAKEAFLPASHIVRKPKVCIVDVQVSNARAGSVKPLLFTGGLTLLSDQRDVTFRYVLPNPLKPRTVSYQYLLKGRDKEWRVTDQRTVQYTGLRGGTYTFLIKAREGDADWSDVTELAVGIEKTLIEYAWFWVVMAIVLGASAIGVYRLMIARTRKELLLKAEFQRKVSEIEMAALRAQMNPHFLFNSLNSIKYYAITRDKNATAEYVSKFAMLVRMILNNSKSRTISLKDELEALRLYIEIEHLRLDGIFDFEIELDSGLRVAQAQIPPMVLQPYVENAIWHGLMHRKSGGLLKVHVRDTGGRVQCIIEDNGIGRVASGQMKNAAHAHKKSVGMQITADRIALINTIYHVDTHVDVVDLYDNEGKAAGTRVIIHIPIIDDSEE